VNGRRSLLAVRPLIVLAVAASLLAAGCGGGGGGGGATSKPLTKAEYQSKLQAIAKEVGSNIQVSSSKKPTKKDLEQVEKALNAFADELEKVSPPAEVSKVHADLIDALRKLGHDLGGIFDKLDQTKGDPSAAIAAFLGAPAIKALLEVQQEFKAKGYDLNLSG
jgi:hypothetical protein